MRLKQLTSILLFLAVTSSYTECKYYQYVDEKGVKHFTEDKGLIPDHSNDDIIEFNDKYDYMSDEEKAAAKKTELLEAEKLKRRRQAELEKYREKARLQEKIARLKKTRTGVTISNNQILVPVTLKYKGNTVTTTLLLDTGANTTVIYDSVAATLEIDSGKEGYARVAGGAVVKARRVKMASINVGPKSLTNKTIFVLDLEGPADRFNGLLGLDFLSNFQHTIDYDNSYINWKE